MVIPLTSKIVNINLHSIIQVWNWRNAGICFLLTLLSDKMSRAVHLHLHLQRISKIIDKKSYSHLSRERSAAQTRTQLGRGAGGEEGAGRRGGDGEQPGERPGSLAAWLCRDFRGEFSTRGSGCVRSSLSLAPFFVILRIRTFAPFS